MKDNLTLLKFPNIKEDINQYRIEEALLSMCNGDDEYEALDSIIVALINFFAEVKNSEMITHDIHKLRASVEVFYDNQ